MKTNLMKKLAAGTILSAMASTGAQADFVINDDLIVDGSACIGFDCVNGESFSFDTIRLKENNLRIKFDDTSVAASFPRNDWQITVNDSVNGGASKFSIDDISGNRTPFTIEAGARSHSLYVDDGGRIGSRTSTPSTEIHTIDGDTPTLRLQQDGSSGFAPQTWDVAGNETNFFIRDVSNGSTLPLRIRPGAPTSSIFIDVDGDVGMGTTSPDAQLEVVSDGDVGLLVSGNGTKQADVQSDDGGAVQLRLISTNTSNRRLVARNGSAGSIQSQIQMGNEEVVIAGSAFGSPFVTINASGIVTTGGGACDPGPCDRTFDPDFYKVESIEDHAEYMWTNKHLWGVGPTEEGKPFNLTRKTTGILHELEKAHIYIEQLNKELKETREMASLVSELRKELDSLKAQIK